MKTYPVKKIIFIIALLLITILVILFFVGRHERGKHDEILGDGLTVEVSNQWLDKDTDNDGVDDLTEAILGTDPGNPDSDGDGTSDGEEVSTNRNPLKAGPDDLLATNIELSTPEITEEEMLELRRNYLKNYLAERGDELKEATLEALVKRVDEQEFDPRYTLDDITIDVDQEMKSYRAYGNTLGAIFAKYGDRKKYPRGETDILKQALETKDASDLKELKLIAAIYEELTRELKATPAPLPFAQDHLILVNGYDILARTIDAMAYMFSEPLRGGLAYDKYLKRTVDIRIGYSGILNTFADLDVRFDATEPGWIFDEELIAQKKAL